MSTEAQKSEDKKRWRDIYGLCALKPISFQDIYKWVIWDNEGDSHP